MALKLVHAEVEFVGVFPIDMLRYDSCWPRTGEDASHIADSQTDSRDKRVVQVTKYSEKKRDHFTTARWKSFLCTIKEVM